MIAKLADGLYHQWRAADLLDGHPGVFYCGLRIISVDGAVSDVPDGKANAQYFGRPSNAPETARLPRSGG